MKNKIISIDTETTGLLVPNTSSIENQPHIIEICAIKFDYEGNTLDEYVTRLKPPIDLPPMITKITGIRECDLKNKPSFVEIYNELASFFVGADILTGHNLAFDRDMLANELLRIDRVLAFPWPPRQICTARETKKMEGYRLTLAKLHAKLFGEDFKDSHSAHGDASAQSRCFFKLIEDGVIKL